MTIRFTKSDKKFIYILSAICLLGLIICSVMDIVGFVGSYDFINIFNHHNLTNSFYVVHILISIVLSILLFFCIKGIYRGYIVGLKNLFYINSSVIILIYIILYSNCDSAVFIPAHCWMMIRYFGVVLAFFFIFTVSDEKCNFRKTMNK
ncbi:MAG: hypothetical protein GY756_06855 [bacterium]|nr:hypothetical protein [bacterium]